MKQRSASVSMSMSMAMSQKRYLIVTKWLSADQKVHFPLPLTFVSSLATLLEEKERLCAELIESQSAPLLANKAENEELGRRFDFLRTQSFYYD